MLSEPMVSCNMEDFTGKNIIITGGAGIGVGGGVCEALHALGAQLLLVDNNEQALQRAKKSYARVRTYHADISTKDGVDALFDQLFNDFNQVDGLVNNAGIGLSKEAHTVEESEYDRLMAVDLKAVWMCSSRFARQLIARRQPGNIVNIASVHTHSTTAKYALYSAAKNGIKGLTMGMAVELGKYQIRVNAVGPGYVHAEQNLALIRTWTDDPEGWVEGYRKNQQAIERIIDPVDVGHVVAFLLSDQARAVTGQLIYVDNGTTSLLFNRNFSE